MILLGELHFAIYPIEKKINNLIKKKKSGGGGGTGV
jgi:hypothetical protein